MFECSMPKIERLSDAITWIDLSFVERLRTPDWAIYEAIRCHIAGMSLRDVSNHLEMWGISRSHVAVHNWATKLISPLNRRRQRCSLPSTRK